jgi:hypothetical protein
MCVFWRWSFLEGKCHSSTTYPRTYRHTYIHTYIPEKTCVVTQLSSVHRYVESFLTRLASISFFRCEHKVSRAVRPFLGKTLSKCLILNNMSIFLFCQISTNSSKQTIVSKNLTINVLKIWITLGTFLVVFSKTFLDTLVASRFARFFLVQNTKT